MSTLNYKLAEVAELAVDQIKESMSSSADTVQDKNGIRDSLAIIREHSRFYSAQTARAGMAVKIAGALGLKKEQLLPVWNALTDGVQKSA